MQFNQNKWYLYTCNAVNFFCPLFVYYMAFEWRDEIAISLYLFVYSIQAIIYLSSGPKSIHRKWCSHRRDYMEMYTTSSPPYILSPKTQIMAMLLKKNHRWKYAKWLKFFLLENKPEPKRYKYNLRINLQNYLNKNVDILSTN